jgi:hypothetical protein
MYVFYAFTFKNGDDTSIYVWQYVNGYLINSHSKDDSKVKFTLTSYLL